MTYLDHAATTGTDRRVVEFLAEELGNPENSSSVHRAGQRARALLEESREELAGIFRIKSDQVVFTSGASEANNLAIRGLCSRIRRTDRPMRVASSPLEHSCIRETLERLASAGEVELSRLPVSRGGQTELDSRDARDGADLLCLMYAQNETGVIQNLAAARDWKEKAGALWLCDGTQALGICDIDLGSLGADLFSCSSHKVYGPPGVGALVGPGIDRVESLITGGPQEGEHRAGTQAVALIRGFVMAVRLAVEERDARRERLANLSRTFLENASERGLNFKVNGEGEKLPGFLNMSVTGFSGADLVIALDARGFAVSSGSACATRVM